VLFREKKEKLFFLGKTQLGLKEKKKPS